MNRPSTSTGRAGYVRHEYRETARRYPRPVRVLP